MPRVRPRSLSFQQTQRAFAQIIRDPKKSKVPRGINNRGVSIYQSLVFNNIEACLIACFPTMRAVLGKRQWTALVRDFLSCHRCQTPLFREVPNEFLEFLCVTRGLVSGDYPFLLELAHYEWVELALSVAVEAVPDGINRAGDLLDERLVMNPVLTLSSYVYAVPLIGKRFKPVLPADERLYILAFRNDRFIVEFIKLNAVAARLLTILIQCGGTGREALERMAQELHGTKIAAIMAGGSDILENLRSQGAILGTQG